MDQLVDIAVGSRQVAEVAHAGRARFSTGGQLHTLGEAGVDAEVALVDGVFIFIEIPRIVRTCQHAGFAPDAFFIVHHDDAVFLVLGGRFRRTGPYARRETHRLWPGRSSETPSVPSAIRNPCPRSSDSQDLFSASS